MNITECDRDRQYYMSPVTEDTMLHVYAHVLKSIHSCFPNGAVPAVGTSDDSVAQSKRRS